MQENCIILASEMCIYCGGSLKGVGKGEHVIPKALGGLPTLGSVCSNCNNAFSLVDDELVSRSPVAFLAREVLGKIAVNVWDYNPYFNFALEARLLPGYQAPCLWPQVLLLEGKQPIFQADYDEMIGVGAEEYLMKFHYYMIRARNELREGKKRPRWIWHRVHQAPRRGHLPPRVFTKHTFDKLSDKTTFECSYLSEVEQGWILWKLDNWIVRRGGSRMGQSLGVIDPESETSFRPRYILRALVKVGINLLVWLGEKGYCREKLVNKYTFPEAVAFALDDLYWDGHRSPESRCGFVRNDDIQDLKEEEHVHKFRLSFRGHSKSIRGWWTLDCAFFGGRVGATVSFPGMNAEAWNTAVITAPTESHDWEVQTSAVAVVRHMSIQWEGASEVVPTLPICNEESKVRYERRKKKR